MPTPSGSLYLEDESGPTVRGSPIPPSSASYSPQLGSRPDLTRAHETTTRMYPLKTVQHPRRKADSDTSSKPLLSPGMASDVGSKGSYTRPMSLDPFLDEPTTGKRRSESDRVGASSATDTLPSEGAFQFSSRFEHQIDEAGQHLIITGRDGVLQKCEDEPIHAPGAIQAFGVLIAFEREEDGKLVVCQVSENSRHIIGISPSALFRAESLADLLSPEEADGIYEAMEALDERELDRTTTETGPIQFELAGTGLPGSGTSDPHSEDRLCWDAYAALHRPSPATRPKLHILELELMEDLINPLKTVSEEPATGEEREGLPYDELVDPSPADLMESTVSLVKPLRALARSRNKRRRAGSTANGDEIDERDFVDLLSQINDQLGRAEDLKMFAKLIVGVFREITEFTRAMVYQFDSDWNGNVVAELVDYSKATDLFAGLNFPASDIPAQARELYRLNKVRLLYDRDQPTARLCCRNQEEVDSPLDMTHSHLRAMSPIHIKYLGNMGVRSSMSISITAFGDLWGLVALHHYGKYGRRVSFPVRQLCKLLGESISRHIERLSYAARLHSRKLINTVPTDENPSGFILAKGEDLLSLFDADFGVLSIGEEAKILGEVSNSQELLAVLEYLRTKQFLTMQTTLSIAKDWPDIDYPGFDMIAGALYVPLSSEGKDFICFFRKGRVEEVKWAGNPYANKTEGSSFQPLEPRKSFATWSEMVVGRCRAWTDEQIESGHVLALVYGKFIAVWREKESAVARSKLNSILLANASHEVRTPLNAIINYLELALDGDLAPEVRANLTSSHAASRSLVHVVNDLLDLTRTERGQELFLQDPFNLSATIDDALSVHKEEATRRGLTLDVIESPSGTPLTLLGDRAKIKTLVASTVQNAIQHTKTGGILVEWGELADADVEDSADKKQDGIRIGIAISDTGVGISEDRLESIFREFEQVSTTGDEKQNGDQPTAAVGLGLAVCARIIRNLGGQLRVESRTEEGSSGTKFTFVLPFRLCSQDDFRPRLSSENGDDESGTASSRTLSGLGTSSQTGTTTTAATSCLVRTNSGHSIGSAGSSKGSIDSLIAGLSAAVMGPTAHVSSHQRVSSRQSSRKSAKGSQGSSAGGSTGTHGTVLRRRGSKGYSNGNVQPSASTSAPAPGPGNIDIEGSGMPLRAVKVDSTLDAAESSFGSLRGSVGSLRSGSGSSGQHGSGGSNAHPIARDAPTQWRTVHGPSSAGATHFSSIPEKQSPTHISEYRQVGDSAEDGITPMRVLVVEDELVNRMILQKRLAKDGHEVVAVVHGGDAMRLLEKDEAWDLVLMDLMMPIMGGLETTEAIREREATTPLPHAQLRPSTILNGRLPVIAVSASLPESNRGQILDAGFDGWCLKPVDVKRLRSLMRGALDIAKRKQEVYTAGAWERGGWLEPAPIHRPPAPPKPIRPRAIPQNPSF